MKYLNLEDTMFSKEIIEDIYVDKTLFIEKIVKLINSRYKNIAFILPRRFGKTSLADMLVAYLSKGADSRDLFANKKIAQIPNWDENLNKHNVIYVDIQDMGDTVAAADFFKTLHKKINTDLIKNYPNINIDINNTFTDNIEIINEETGEQFIFIFDEYDVILREKKYIDIAEDYIELINKLTKGGNFNKHVSLVYLTGILPLKIGSSNSKLNNASIKSIIKSDGFEDFIGFKENEVIEICNKYNERNDIIQKVEFNEVKKWYNGYNLENGISIYNPFAITEMLKGKKPDYSNHWSETSSFETLKKYIIFKEEKIYNDEIGTRIETKKLEINSKIQYLKESGVYEDITLLAKQDEFETRKNKIKTKLYTFVSDLDSIASKNHLYSLLIYLGYLTYDYETNECYIPNKEILEKFDETMNSSSDYRFLNEMLNNSKTLLEKTIKLDTEYVKENFHIVHHDFNNFKFFNNEGAFHSFISVAYYSALKDYNIKYTYKPDEGYAVAVLIPRRECSLSKVTERPPIVIELKHGKEDYIDPKVAIEQIKTKQYFYEIKKDEGLNQGIIVGLTYCKNKQDVYEYFCDIEKYEI